MLKRELRELFASRGIMECAAIPFSDCHITRPDKLKRYGFGEGEVLSVLLFLSPYYAGEDDKRNISRYAASFDYHQYFEREFVYFCEELSVRYPGYRFHGSADNAPMDERHAAAVAGLGIYGDNGLLISRVWGSYCFIGEILCDIPPEELCEDRKIVLSEPEECSHCGACRRICPMQPNGNPYGITECLSAINQKKHLTQLEEKYIRYFNAVWGCDLCQECCPHNRDIPKTEIPYFLENRTPYLTPSLLERMAEEEFSRRAYAWRGREPVLRNARLIEEDRMNGIPTKEMTDAITAIIRSAGEIMTSAVAQESAENVHTKAGAANYVTAYDVRVQKFITERFSKLYPEAYFFAEEKENDPARFAHGDCFIIDPIDGTTNFMHGFGMSVISVGLFHEGKPVLGAVYNPYQKKMWLARRGLGAECNGVGIHVSEREPDHAVYCVGTTPYYRDTLGDRTFILMRELFNRSADIRRFGSAATDLVFTAQGVADGYCELLISPWDFAAGALIVEEAGGIVTNLAGAPLDFSRPTGIIAGTKKTHSVILAAVKKSEEMTR